MYFLLQSSSAAPTDRTPMGGMTSFTLILIAVLAVVVIIGLIVGTRLKHRRKEGIAEFEREEAAELERQQSRAAPAPAAAAAPLDEPPAAAPATAPLPPPLDDGPAPGGMISQQGAYSTPSPQPAAPPAPAPPTAGPADGGELTQLKGLGPKVAAAMADAGITSLAQLAALSPDAEAALDARLGTFRGRLARDRWVEQARLLTSGDRAGYEAAFGKLG